MKKYNTIFGIDLSDKKCNWAMMTYSSEEIQDEGITKLTRKDLYHKFRSIESSLIAIEAGSQSAWVERLFKRCGHKVIVANPRKLRMIYSNDAKSDKVDAQMLVRVARLDTNLLHPIKHRRKKAQCDLSIIRARDILVRSRSSLVCHIRSTVKSLGVQIPTCDAHYFHRHAKSHIPRDLKEALIPVLKTIENLTESITAYDKSITKLCKESYPDTEILQSVPGIGDITALSYVLTLDDPKRFEKSRDVGSYLGLTQRKDQSGNNDPQLGITKAGDDFMRRLLVGAAQYILGNRNNKDSALRQWGLKLAGPPDKNGKYNKKLKKRAVVAVARKLACLLHTLWSNGMFFEPFPNAKCADNEQQLEAA